jgi:SAM-dependent methyltransferase
MKRIYDNPLYYEVAFSFRDISQEVDTMERCIKLFSLIPVRRMLELGCGPAPHIIELTGRGYEYLGIDLNPKMLDFAESKATRAGLSATLLNQDMVRFELEEQVDFAFVLLGSLFASNTAELISHFESTAAALRPGGIYLLDWCVQFDKMLEGSDSWVIERDNIRTETFCSTRYVDPVGQTMEEILRIEVDDQGNKLELEDKRMRRVIYPQEFKLLIEKKGCFEFIGWWNNWNLDDSILEGESYVSERKIERPITVIRRKR